MRGLPPATTPPRRIADAILGRLKLRMASELAWYVLEFAPTYTLAATDEDGSVYTWDAWNSRAPRKLGKHNWTAGVAKFLPDGETLVTGSEDMSVMVWNTSGGLLQVFRGHMQSVTGIEVFPTSDRVLTYSVGGDVLVWHPTSGQELHRLEHEHPSFMVRNVKILPDGRTVLVVLRSMEEPIARVSLWKTGGVAACLAVFSFECSCCDAAAIDSDTVLTCEHADMPWETWTVFQASTGARLTGSDTLVDEGSHEHSRLTRCLGVAESGRVVVEASNDLTEIVVRDTATGELRSRRLHSYPSGWNWGHALFLPDATRLIIFQMPRLSGIFVHEGKGYIWEFHSDAEPKSLGVFSLLRKLPSVSTDGRNLVTYQHSGVSLWDLRTAKLLHTLRLPSETARFSDAILGGRRVQVAISRPTAPAVRLL